ncbi:hypothetical protein ACFYY2_12100 [Streptomyces sp. NPDC001822]|uniref:hypothetical protein n=1 Tax=Streptomyces sp. NPDC001822 TaxID=3364614 RepID=UPI00369D6744
MSTSQFKRGDYVFVHEAGRVTGAGQITDGCLESIPFIVRMAGTNHYVQKWGKDLEIHPQQDYRHFLKKEVPVPEKTYTEAQVSEAVNAAMDLIIGEIECDQEWEDLLSLMANATLTVLKSEMGADLEDVVEENYGEELDEFKSARGF